MTTEKAVAVVIRNDLGEGRYEEKLRRYEVKSALRQAGEYGRFVREYIYIYI